jgi:hypothetical protein
MTSPDDYGRRRPGGATVLGRDFIDQNPPVPGFDNRSGRGISSLRAVADALDLPAAELRVVGQDPPPVVLRYDTALEEIAGLLVKLPIGEALTMAEGMPIAEGATMAPIDLALMIHRWAKANVRKDDLP